MSATGDVITQIIEERGYRAGTSLENQVALFLSHSICAPDLPEQQYAAGRFRLDFAWPRVLMAIEADGWHHRSPASATRDRERDSWLRSRGWMVFRVDDEHGEDILRHQVMRAARCIRFELTAGRRWEVQAR